MLSVLITGSEAENSEVKGTEFVERCEQIGRLLYGSHRIVVAATLPHNADHHVLCGAIMAYEEHASSSNTAFNVELFSAQNDESNCAPRNAMLQKLVGLDLKGVVGINVHRKTNNTEAWQEAIDACDVVLIIGGTSNPETIYAMALHSRKPVLGFPSFGGVGRKAMSELRQVYNLIGITKDHTYVLDETLEEEKHAKALCSLLQMVAERNPWALSNASAARLSLMVLIGLSLLWIVLFALAHGLTPISLKHWYFWPMPLCVIAGMVGGAGRTLLQRPSSTESVSANIMLNVGAGLAVGFSIASYIILAVFCALYGPKNDAGIPYMTLAFMLGSGMSVAAGLWGFNVLGKVGKVVGKLIPHH